MEVSYAIKLLKNERECVDTDACDRNCGECMLAGDKNEILQALDMAINTLTVLDVYVTIPLNFKEMI